MIQLADGADDHSVLVRHNRRTRELAYYLCWLPYPQPLTALIRVAGRREAIEEAFQAAKSQVGLDHHQVRRWISGHRTITLTMVALAFLALLAASHQQPTTPERPLPADAAAPPDPHHPIPLTLAELRHLIAHLVIRPIHDTAHFLRWSAWRRQHQARARYCHYRQRATSP